MRSAVAWASSRSPQSTCGTRPVAAFWDDSSNTVSQCRCAAPPPIPAFPAAPRRAYHRWSDGPVRLFALLTFYHLSPGLAGQPPGVALLYTGQASADLAYIVGPLLAAGLQGRGYHISKPPRHAGELCAWFRVRPCSVFRARDIHIPRGIA